MALVLLGSATVEGMAVFHKLSSGSPWFRNSGGMAVFHKLSSVSGSLVEGMAVFHKLSSGSGSLVEGMAVFCEFWFSLVQEGWLVCCLPAG